MKVSNTKKFVDKSDTRIDKDKLTKAKKIGIQVFLQASITGSAILNSFMFTGIKP
ncbi:MAG: hypothetical protein ABI045_04310 [Flavobacteriales bacterium]